MWCVVLVAASGCGGGSNASDDSPDSTEGSPTSSESAEAPDPTEAESTDDGSTTTPTWPSTTERPAPVAFELSTKCGVVGTMIDGVWWEAQTPMVSDSGGAPAGWNSPVHVGELQFLGDGAWAFVAPEGVSAVFVRTEATEPPATCA